MKGGPCDVPRDWRVVADQVVVMSDLREPDNKIMTTTECHLDEVRLDLL